VVEQAVFASSTFLFTLLLARWAEPADYGAWTVCFGLFGVFGTLHSACLLEPGTVWSAGRHGSEPGRYGAWLTAASLTAGLTAGAALAALALVLLLNGLGPEAGAVAALAAATPFVLAQWMLRRLAILRRRFATAAVIFGVQAAALVGGASILDCSDALNAWTAASLYGFAALGAAAALAAALGVRPRLAAGSGWSRRRLADHFDWARWAVPSAALAWLPTNCYTFALPLIAGLEEAAALGAATALMMPALNALLALAAARTPWFAECLANGGQPALRVALRRTSALALGGAAAWSVVLICFGEIAFRALFPGKLAIASEVVIWTAAAPPAYALTMTLDAALRASGRLRAIFVARLAAAATALLVGPAAAYALGARGAAAAQSLALMAAAALMAREFRPNAFRARIEVGRTSFR